MRFLANENFSLPSVNLLKEAGLDIVSITNTRPGISDIEVLSQAINEERIILTFDRDYGNLIFNLKLGNPISVVYFRFKPSDPLDATMVFKETIMNAFVELEGWFVVLDREGLRKRKM